MRQLIDYPTLTSYAATIAADLLAGYTLTALNGCTVTVNAAVPVLPYTFVVADALAVTHAAAAGKVSSLRLQTPDDGTAAATSAAVPRLSSTQVVRPILKGNGGAAAAVRRTFNNFVMAFTLTARAYAEGVVISTDDLSLTSVTSISIEDAVGSIVATNVGSVARDGGDLRITFAQVANLIPGAYTLRIFFAANTSALLTTTPLLQNGVTSLDLLRKSGPDGHTVTEGRDEIDPKAEPATPVAIGFFQDAEDFEPTNDVLDG